MGLEASLIMMFMVKHLIFDWLLQNKWMADNKHQLDHPAGYAHAGINVLGTLIASFIFVAGWGTGFTGSGELFFMLLLGEFISHFFMDYTKMNIVKSVELDPMKHKFFWDLTGFDQFVHLAYLVFMGGMLV